MAGPKSTYGEKLKDPRWQKVRLEIFERDGWSCTKCGARDQTLHVHHKVYRGDPWDAPRDYLATLCENCHAAEGGYSLTPAQKIINRRRLWDPSYGRARKF